MPKNKHEEEEKAAKAAAKEEEKAAIVETPVLNEREMRWMAFIEAHKKQNPVKHAQRLAQGAFKTIPDSFV